MQLAAYLDRIGYEGEVRPDLATLRALHRAHLLAIPYDGLDIQLGRRVTNDPAEAYEKIVERGRGGWCYEMNGLFGWALGVIGFEVTRHAGSGGESGSHLALEVRLDQPWMCDVGFGEGPIEPYPLVDGEFEQRGFRFRLERLERGWRFHNHRFGLVPRFDFAGPDEAAMAERCLALQSATDSPYVQNAIVLRQTSHGYVTLIGRELRTVTAAGRAGKQVIADASDYLATLERVFGLDVPEAAELWPSICRRHEQIEAQRAAAAAART